MRSVSAKPLSVFALVALVLFAATAFAPRAEAQRQAFNFPRMNGAIVDHCRTWATDCGRGGAVQYCRRRGYQNAATWSIYRPGRTYVIGSNRYCNGGGCVGFRQVVCVGRAGPPPPPPGRRAVINYPRWNGRIVDHCRTWATNCGAGGANYYCRLRGFQQARRWTVYRPGSTFVIGSGRVCNGGGCVGFRQVVCVGTRTGGVVPPPGAGGGGGGGAVVRINYPRMRGAIVDHCVTWATNCGRGGATQYCRRRGFRNATSWATYRPGRTYVIGSNRYCNGGGCVGFRYVNCRR